LNVNTVIAHELVSICEAVGVALFLCSESLEAPVTRIKLGTPVCKQKY
jgi:hypothetical protein